MENRDMRQAGQKNDPPLPRTRFEMSSICGKISRANMRMTLDWRVIVEGHRLPTSDFL
jgi:hypothetical protein